MARTYSPELLSIVDTTEGDNVGITLAKACIEANLPAAYVAEILGVSRMGIHAWFRGGYVRSGRREKIRLFLELLREDTEAGLLPAKNLKEARTYTENILGRAVTTASKKSG